MTTQRILILNGHPAETSLSKSLAEAYFAAAKAAGHDVRTTHLHDMEFDADFGGAGYVQIKPLEPVLKTFQEDVTWAEHIVLVTPMWWGGLPAKLKGLFDRAFLPGWAFDPRNRAKSGLPAPMLGGRTGRTIMTSDTPGFFFWLLYRNALIRQIKSQIFHFVGIKPMKVTHFSGASKADSATATKWIETAASLGRQGA